MQHVIDINNVGGVEALYSDKVNLTQLGPAIMERASHILFNELTQLWDVIPVLIKNYDALPKEYKNWTSYEKAIEFEVLVLNKARGLGLLSAEGLSSNKGFVIAENAYFEVIGIS